MSQIALNQTLYFETTDCCVCGLTFALPHYLNKKRLEDHKSFYCPNGHSQTYVGETEVEKLQKQLAERDRAVQFERNRAERMTAELAKKARAEKHLKRRIANGVCPCCHRTVKQLAAHMKTKHPDYSPNRRLRKGPRNDLPRHVRADEAKARMEGQNKAHTVAV